MNKNAGVCSRGTFTPCFTTDTVHLTTMRKMGALIKFSNCYALKKLLVLNFVESIRDLTQLAFTSSAK